MRWPTCDEVAERLVVAGHPLVRACTRLRWHLGRHRHEVRPASRVCTCVVHRHPAGGGHWRDPACPFHGNQVLVPPTGL